MDNSILKMKIRSTRILFVLFLSTLLSGISLNAQNTFTYRYSQNPYLDGKEAFEKGKFNLSSELFTQYLMQQKTKPALKEEAELLILVANLYSDKLDAEYQLRNYIDLNRNDYFTNQAYFYLGDYNLTQKDIKNASRNFSRCEKKKLPQNLKREYEFKHSLVLLNEEKLPEAYVNFKEISENKKHPYQDDATYYCGYIHYMSGEYQEANQYFNQVTNPVYINSIEHYELQYEFLTGNLDESAKKASAMYNSSEGEFRAEIARILGYISYSQNNVEKAADYYEVYQRNVEKLSREDIYLLGESYYALKEYDKAADAFTKVATLEDELSQNAYNKLAACYIQSNDKQMARMAFESASRYEFNKEIQEEALFNYCKLTYELSYSPFNEIIVAFESFLKLFPDSKHTSEVYTLLSEVFLNTNNYEKAYESLKGLNINNPQLEHAMQRVAYFRAIELFNNLKFGASIDYFTKSLENSSHDKALKAQANYWRGEAYFRMDQQNKALADFNAFIQSPHASRQDEFTIAHYSLGYTYFKLNQPSPAIIWFSKYVTLQKSNPDIRLADSYNRLGDSYYLKRDFKKAIKYYNYAIDMGLNSSDYAYYQKAFCQGLLKDYPGKISTLNTLTRIFDQSVFLDDAYFEKGKTYATMDEKVNALLSYQRLVDDFPQSLLRPKAYTNMALIHYNADDEKEAVKLYKQVVEKYPLSPEASVSLNALKSIAIDNNSVDDYIRYTKKLGNRVNLTGNDADSLTYISAEKIYMKGNVENSSQYFSDYIGKFPNGKYVLNAHYYKADCHLQMDQQDEAITDLKAIVEFPTNEYTEEALAKLASIYYQKKDFSNALPYFDRMLLVAKLPTNILDAKAGILRCQYNMGRCDKVLSALSVVLSEQQISDELWREAYYYKAKCLLKQNKPSEAMAAFQQIAKDTRNEYGAEAKYQIADLYYKNNQPAKAVAEVKDFIEKNTPHQYWLAKAFIIMAQVSIDKGDDFDAKQYLVSVKENYTGRDDVQEEVARLIFEIDNREAQRYQHRRDSLMKLLNDTSAQ